MLFSRNRDMQVPVEGEKCWGTGLKADPLCTPQKLLLAGFSCALDSWMGTRSCFPVAHSSLSDLKCL